MKYFFKIIAFSLGLGIIAGAQEESLNPSGLETWITPAEEVAPCFPPGGTFARGVSANIVSTPNDWNIALNYTNAMPLTNPVPQEIKEVVRGLKNDPKRIFEFVRNHYDFQPYFGLMKGFEKTYMDRGGSDADLCGLLAVMLGEAGYTSEFVEGWMTIPAADLAKWTRVDSTLPYDDLSNFPVWQNSARAITAPFFQGGIYYDPQAVYVGTKISFKVHRTLLKVQVGGTTHYLDPGFKFYRHVDGALTPAALESAMGYSRTALLTALGGTPVTNGYQGFNETSVRSLLTVHTTNLVNHILTQHRGKTLVELLGGHELIPAETPTLPTTTFVPFTILGSPFSSYPAHRKHYMRVKFGVIDKVFATCDIASKRLYFTFDSSRKAHLWADDTEIAAESTVGAANEKILLGIDHPYNTNSDFYDKNTQESASNTRMSQIKAIPKQFAPTFNDRWFSRLREEISDLRIQGVVDTDRRMLSRSLEMYGAGYIAERVGYRNLIQTLAGGGFGNSLYQGDAGLVFQGATKYGIDWLSIAGSAYGGKPVASNGDSLFYDKVASAFSYFSGALEHGLIDQLQRAQGGVSTVRALSFANKANQTIYYATDANFSAVRSQLASGGWPTDMLASIDTHFSPGTGTRMLVHRNHNAQSGITGDTWSGGGYWYKPATGSAAGGFIISGLYNGGSATSSGAWNPFTMLGKALGGLFDFGVGTIEGIFGLNPVSAEPVDLATGSYLSDHTDLIIGNGESPRGISFSRSYNSGKSKESHALGYGWTHNWDVKLKPYTHFPIQFGGRLPVDTAAQIVAGFIALDLGSLGQDDAKELMGLMFVGHWGTDQLVDNVAALSTGHRIDLFTKQPDGSFTSPPGVTSALTKAGTNYSLAQRHGNTHLFTTVNGEQRLSSITDQHGKTLNVAYLNNRISRVSDCWNRYVDFQYDGSNQLTALADSTGRIVDFGHNAGDLTTCTDPDNNTSTFVYQNHRITDWLDEQSRPIAKNFYSPLGKVERQHSEGNPDHEWTFYWTGYDNRERDPMGNEKRYIFDELGRHIGLIDAEERSSNVTYNTEDLPVKMNDALGRSAVNEYNSDLNKTSRKIYSANDTLLRTQSFQYDANKRLWKSTNGRNYTTEFIYSAQHKIIKTIFPDAKYTEVDYNADGTLNWTKDRVGAQTTYSQYDNYGNAKKVTSPLSKFIEYEYSILGDAIKTWDTKRNLTRIFYNKRRMPRETIDATNRVSSLAYDGKGNRISATDRLGRTAGATYNALGKVLTETNAIQKVTITNYNARDLPWTVTSPGGRVRETLYDPAGRVDRIELPVGYTEYDFDDAGRQTLVENALGEQLLTGHNDIARTVTTTNPATESVTKKADLNGNLVEITNARTFTTVMEYDSLDRLETITTPENKVTSTLYQDQTLERREIVTVPSLLHQISRHYNAGGQLDWILDGEGTISFGYDDNGALQTVTEGGQTATYAHSDPLNRVTSYTDEKGASIAYGHDVAGAPAGRYRSSISYPGTQGPVMYDRDKLDRLVKITDWAGRESTFTYYDNHANGEDGELDEIKRPNNTVRKHFYDVAGRLRRVDELDATGYIIARFDLTLDDVGKVDREFRMPKIRPSPADSWTATYNKDDQFLTHSGGTFGYDPDGNLTAGPGKAGGLLVNQTYDFNARNQLVEVPTAGATYTYNAEGHLKSRTIGSSTTGYLVSPVGGLPQILAATTGVQTTRYVYGLGLLYEEKPDGTIRSYHFDYRGNTVALCEADGITVTARAQYTPYGRLSQTTGTLDTPFQYNGRYGVLTDAATGLVHMRARWYSPYLKRFINIDPSGFAGGMNFYAFAAGNPIMFADPTGLGPWYSGTNLGRAVGNALNGVTLGVVDYFTEVYQVFHPNGDPSLSTGGYVNGILGDNEANHQREADNTGISQIFNPSNGFVADIVQAGLGILLFGWGDSLAQSLGPAMWSMSQNALSNMIAHSQATVHFTNSLLWGYSPSVEATLNSPAIPELRSNFIAGLSGSTLHYNQPFGDVANLYSMNINIFSFGAALYIPRAINTHLDASHINLNNP